MEVNVGAHLVLVVLMASLVLTKTDTVEYEDVRVLTTESETCADHSGVAMQLVLACRNSSWIQVHSNGSTISSHCDQGAPCCVGDEYETPIHNVTHLGQRHWDHILSLCNNMSSCSFEMLEIRKFPVLGHCIHFPYCEIVTYSCIRRQVIEDDEYQSVSTAFVLSLPSMLVGCVTVLILLCLIVIGVKLFRSRRKSPSGRGMEETLEARYHVDQRVVSGCSIGPYEDVDIRELPEKPAEKKTDIKKAKGKKAAAGKETAKPNYYADV